VPFRVARFQHRGAALVFRVNSIVTNNRRERIALAAVKLAV
jgi:hypothetical protein